MYVKRNAQGEVLLVSREPTPECNEYLEANAPELQTFMLTGGSEEERALLKSDLEFVRVLEDLLDLLMNQGVISFTDLPQAAQKKLMSRQSLRKRLDSVDLLDDDNLLGSDAI